MTRNKHAYPPFVRMRETRRRTRARSIGPAPDGWRGASIESPAGFSAAA